MVDSGSLITIVSERLATRLGLAVNRADSFDLKQVSTHTRSIGTANIGHTIAHKHSSFTVHVLSTDHFDFLLGLDTCTHFTINIQPCLISVTIDGNRVLALLADAQPSQPSNDFVRTLVQEFANLFAKDDTDIGRLSVEHRIHTIDSPPIALRPYRHSVADKCEIRRQVAALKKKGLIRDSTSSWSLPVTLANKKDSTRRMCIDFRRLNH